MAYNSQKNIMVNSIGELLGDRRYFRRLLLSTMQIWIFLNGMNSKTVFFKQVNAADECGIGKARLLVIPYVLTCIEDERPFVLATTAFAFLVCNFSSRNSRISCLLYYGTLFVLLSLLCTSDQTTYETVVPCLPHFSPIQLTNPTFPWYTTWPVIDSAFIRIINGQN